MMEQNKKRLATEIVVAVIVALTIGGLLLLNRYYQSLIEDKNAEIASLKSQQEARTDVEQQAEQPIADTQQYVVAFTPSGLFTDSEKQEITTKLIEPLVDFEKEQGSNSDLVSINVQHPIESDESTDYIIDVIYKDGAYQGFVYGDSGTQEQPWYQPTCMDACEFSEAYRQKYPAVVGENEQ